MPAFLYLTSVSGDNDIPLDYHISARQSSHSILRTESRLDRALLVQVCGEEFIANAVPGDFMELKMGEGVIMRLGNVWIAPQHLLIQKVGSL